MYRCSEKLITCKEHCCFDHSDLRHIKYLHLIYAEVAWVLVSSGTQVQPQVILNPDYLPDYLSISYDYVLVACFCKFTNAKFFKGKTIFFQSLIDQQHQHQHHQELPHFLRYKFFRIHQDCPVLQVFVPLTW